MIPMSYPKWEAHTPLRFPPMHPSILCNLTIGWLCGESPPSSMNPSPELECDRTGIARSILISDADRTFALMLLDAGHAWIGGLAPDFWGVQDIQIHLAVETKANALLKS